MDDMPMCDGLTMSMVWMRMPGQTWPGAAASFLGIWIVMMVAMMLPSLTPTLWRYHQAVGVTDEARPSRLTMLVGAGYFITWALFGIMIYPLGATLTIAEMQWPPLVRAAPIMVGGVVLIAGILQLTEWKARHLAYCRAAPGRGCTLVANASTAWQYGVRLGLQCCYSCIGLMAILLAGGIMDWRVMCIVMAAITAERLAPDGELVARAIGYIAVAAGVLLIVLNTS